ncbi:unnamed protein product [Trichobilharzia regenti]|nr:unnamed protein product [Trichobilharzia regenti]
MFHIISSSPFFFSSTASANPNEGEPSIQRQHSESLEPIVDRQPIGVLASMRETILPGFCVLLTLLVTLSIFPAVASRIRPMNVIPGDKWTSKQIKVFLHFDNAHTVCVCVCVCVSLI